MAMLRLASSLNGYRIAATDGAIGSVSDTLFDDTTWKLRWLVADTGAWLGGARVLIHPSMLGVSSDEDRTLSVRLSKVQVKNSPGRLHDRPVSQQMEDDLYNYFGWDPLWGASTFGPDSGQARRRDAGHRLRAGGTLMQVPQGDPHLRSVSAVTGYHVLASDGEIGHVQDFLVDDEMWLLKYLIVDTSNWWIGEHVLVSPFAVTEINYSSSRVTAGITRERVKTSPRWSLQDPADEPYQQRLHDHYQWPGYGWAMMA
jgi:hypothetical protein